MNNSYVRWMKGYIKVWMLFVLIFSLGVSQPISIFAEKRENAITWLEKANILNSSFNLKEIKKNPEKLITRQEFIALLMSAAGVKGTESEAEQLKFADNGKIKKVYKNSLGAAYSLGVVQELKGSGKTYLRPQKVLTRQMAAYYLGRCLNTEIDLPLAQFKDYEKIYPSCQRYVTALISLGIQKGETYTEYQPLHKMTWSMAGELVRTAYEAGYFKAIDTDILSDSKKTDAENQNMKLLHAGGIALDEESDILYIADTRHNQIKAIEDGKLRVVAGMIIGADELGQCIGGYADGMLDKSMFNQPSAVILVEGGLLVADTGNHAIRYINLANKTVTTYAGTGKAGSQNGKKSAASFQFPQDLAMATDGTIYVADTGNQCIRMISTGGEVSTLAGTINQSGYLDGASGTALFNEPTGISVTDTAVYVADCGNQRIRKVSNGVVSTVAGVTTEKDVNSDEYLGGFYDGSVSEALFCQPSKLTVGKDGTIYVSDTGNRMIRRIKDGTVTTVAGFGSCVNREGIQWENLLSEPAGLAVSSKEDKLYIADSFLNHVISVTMKNERQGN